MLSRLVIVRSRAFVPARVHFKGCVSTIFNGSFHRHQGANQLFETSETFVFARHASTFSTVPPQITKLTDGPTVDLSLSAPSSESSLDSLVSSVGPIPDLPLPAAPKALEILSNGEPSLSSLGLCSYWPQGWFQQLLEVVHVNLDLPWWSTLLLVTTAVRLCIFPVVVKQIKATSTFANTMPTINLLQTKISEARAVNDYLTVARYSIELQEYMKEKQPSPLTTLKYMFVQVFILVSMTSGLREMCNLPVRSLQTGGFLHVQDLTACDPTYMLPGVCSLVLFTTLKLGVDWGPLSKSPWVQGGIVYGVPVLLLAFSSTMHNFIVIYWTANGVIGLVQTQFIKHPKIRKYFNIPDVVQSAAVKAEQLKKKANKRSFYDGLKDSFQNMRVSHELQQRSQVDEMTFERAGREPIRKTYKYNPKAPPLAKKVS